MRKVVILDTSVFCVYLQIPGFTTAGPDRDRWDYDRIHQKIDQDIESGDTLVLPLATLIETGNHISQAAGDRYQVALLFTDVLRKSIDHQHPWAAFTEQSTLWGEKQLRQLADHWPKQAQAGISLGDATIIEVAQYYAKTGAQVEIFTGDEGLKAYQPMPPTALVPRRRK